MKSSRHGKKASIAGLLTILFAFALSGQFAQADTPPCTELSGNNINSQNYSRWASPMMSALVQTGSTELMRFQADAVSDTYYVEYYDLNYQLKRIVTVDEELPLYGGFYYDGTSFYVLSGQNNNEEDDSQEVYRLTKFDSSWKRLGAASLCGANTYHPFAAGSARMDHEGNMLFIRTCHTMYKDSNGLHHQANVTIQINTDDMSVIDSYTKISSTAYGYVSHSFNQFIKLDSGRIVGVDHGDAAPRSVVLMKYKTDYTPTGFSKPVYKATMLDISGNSGANDTGVSVGGFEISSDHYLVAGNSVEMGEAYSADSIRNIFVSSVDRDLTESPVIHWITSYEPDETSPSTPQLVKIDDTHFLLMWVKDEVLNYCAINNNGEMTGSIRTMDASLSDCVPIIVGRKIVWYTWKNDDISFHEIDADNIATSNTVAVYNGHTYEYTPAPTGTNIASRQCTKCGKTGSFTTLAAFTFVWINNAGPNTWSLSSKSTIGSTYQAHTVTREPTDADNWTIAVASSDESVASTDGASVTFLKHGVATITVYAKYNPEMQRQETCVVSHGITSKSTVKVSTCSEAGIRDYTCSCGETIREILPLDPANHVRTRVENAVEPTCAKSGYSGDTYCSDCGELIKSGTEVAKSSTHTYGEWRTTITPTCTTTGKKIHTCTVCNVTKYTILDKDSTNHSGDQVLKDSKEATCGVAGYTGDTCCSACNAVVKKGSSIPATGKHAWDEGKITTPADCVSKGKKTYTCSACSKTKKETIAIDSSNHTGNTLKKGAYGATCVKQGYSGDTYCKDCGVLISKGAATPKLKPTIKLSTTSKAIKKKKSFVLTVSCLGKGDSIVSVKASKSSVAAVKGLRANVFKVTGKKKGKATITVKLKSGKTAICKVTVK